MTMQDDTIRTSTTTDPVTGGKFAYATDMAIVYLLTPCCGASGKGAGYSETGVVCRACYTDVSPDFGDYWTLEAIAQDYPQIAAELRQPAN